MRRQLSILLFLLLCLSSVCARNVRIYGYVVDSDNRGIELANVYEIGSTPSLPAREGENGTTTNKNGYYELMLMEPSDTITLVFSMVGYTTVYQRIVLEQGTSTVRPGDRTSLDDVLNVNVEMATSEEWLEEVEVRGVKRQTTMMDHIDATTSRVMPDATGGSIESLLITFAGVNQNNELSSQYNVRGGSFDENVVYVNGIEVHRPLLIRSGQQEGLSFVNPSMVENVEFSAGGYGAQYGDKMASVLDIRYKQPERFEGSLSASLLGASVYVGTTTTANAERPSNDYKTTDAVRPSDDCPTTALSDRAFYPDKSGSRCPTDIVSNVNQSFSEAVGQQSGRTAKRSDSKAVGVSFSQMHGIRYKTSQYMLGSLATAGNYQPNYFDYQTMLTWEINRDKTADAERPSNQSDSGAVGQQSGRTAERSDSKAVGAGRGSWKTSFLGNVSVNDYVFQPDSMSESWGGLDAKHLNIWYDGQEKDRFVTAFAALSTGGQVSREVSIGFDASGFYTNERETYDITGEYVLSNKSLDAENPDMGSGRPGEMVDPSGQTDVLGTGKYHQHARNRLEAGVATLSHHGEWKRGQNSLTWGVSAQGEWIRDHISEWEWRDSAGYSLPNNGQDMLLYYAMQGDSSMQSARVQGYVQNTHKWNTDKGQVILTVGGRLQWWSWTNEVLPSPRASLVYIPGWKRDFSFRLATGLYYQAPFYKELRDTLTGADGVTRISLTRDLKAQRSVHVVLGGDYYFRAWGRPFKFTAEAYYKYIDRMESYTVDNVRVRYSGKNDSEGYAAGLDLKLYGELVPGADSWISFSVMSAKQRLLDRPDLGWIPSPQEQRYSFSMLFQDYVPQFPQLKFHLKMLWSDGMPFAAPRDYASMKTLRMSDYRRIDIGATYAFNAKTAKFMRAPSAKHVAEWAIQFEVFNLVGWKNVNSYFWVSDAYGQQWASPNYLTGRRYNLKLTVDLK
ncbi:MAG: TonB-dependent receptor [Paludibacteraceae bacterium]|nr:TonB-dependent receptor [Paludibacteraceae bacterium]